jgi:hypothetical protein
MYVFPEAVAGRSPVQMAEAQDPVFKLCKTPRSVSQMLHWEKARLQTVVLSQNDALARVQERKDSWHRQLI